MDGEDEAFREGFHGISLAKLHKMSDLELAEWQASQKPGSAKFIIAEYEWKLRLMRQSVSASGRFGILGTILGTVLGAALAWWLAPS